MPTTKWSKLDQTTYQFICVEKIKPEAKLIDDLGADSLTAVEIVMELEKELGVDIDDSEVEKIVTVQDVINIVESKK